MKINPKLLCRFFWRFSWRFFCGFCLVLSACASSLPTERHDHYTFPEHDVFKETPTGKDSKRPYEVLGWVRAKAGYPTFEQAEVGGAALCVNYFNKAAASLLDEAEKAGGDAVIQVRSVVLTLDGKFQEYPTPECSDDGAEGEILLKGIAIRYKKITQ